MFTHLLFWLSVILSMSRIADRSINPNSKFKVSCVEFRQNTRFQSTARNTLLRKPILEACLRSFRNRNISCDYTYSHQNSSHGTCQILNIRTRLQRNYKPKKKRVVWMKYMTIWKWIKGQTSSSYCSPEKYPSEDDMNPLPSFFSCFFFPPLLCILVSDVRSLSHYSFSMDKRIATLWSL